MLSSPEDPHCMHCRAAWGPDFIDSVLTKTFRSGPLKKHREDVLLDRERSMLPATQPAVEQMLQERRLRSRIADLGEQRAELTREIWRLQRLLRDVWRRREAMDDVATGGGNGSGGAERRQFIKPCPAVGCRGFLSTAYKCGVCETRVCPTCHEIKTDQPDAATPHVCDPAVVESVRAIARDSKPCPKCGSMIFRVSGCSQMFCTVPQCNTAFDWNTGRVVTGHIHNPHYYEFLRQQQRREGPIGRELGDIPCGGMPTAGVLSRALGRASVSGLGAEVVRELLNAHNLIVHVTDYELRHRYPPPTEPAADAAQNRDLRIRYLLNELTDEQFKRLLQLREKARLKSQAVHQVLAMVANVSADMLRQLVLDCTPRTADDTMTQARLLREYVNTSLDGISRRFACVVPHITPGWQMESARASSSS